MKPIQKKYKLRDKRRPNQNMPSRRYQVNVFWEVFQEDNRGYQSNGKYHKKFSRILRAKEKAETIKEIKECGLK